MTREMAMAIVERALSTICDDISAGVIRQMGFTVDPRIPDCAVVPRRSLRFEVGGITSNPSDRSIRLETTLQVLEPFKWVEATVELDGEV